MAYDLWHKTRTGRDLSISLPKTSSSGSWLEEKMSGLVPWQKVAAIGGAVLGTRLLVRWLAASRRPAHIPATRFDDPFTKTQPLPKGESMTDIVHRRLR